MIYDNKWLENYLKHHTLYSFSDRKENQNITEKELGRRFKLFCKLGDEKYERRLKLEKLFKDN